MEVNFKSNKDATLKEFQRKKKLALNLIGEAAEGHAKANCPVDTGRLRNSISHKTVEDAAYVGTNVEYALWVEIKDISHKTGQAHFLRDAATQHSDEYRSIAEQVMKE